MKIENQRAIGYPLEKLAAELDKCGPELRRLIRLACQDAGRVTRERELARLRLHEAVTCWTKEAVAAGAAAEVA